MPDQCGPKEVTSSLRFGDRLLFVGKRSGSAARWSTGRNLSFNTPRGVLGFGRCSFQVFSTKLKFLS